jgi:Ca2+-transporting ATPase
VILIFLGQIGIITFGGQMFNVEQIAPLHWLYIITGTSAILIVGEVARAIKVSFRRQL